MGTIHETAEELRRMGETDESIKYLLGHEAVAPSLLQVFGQAIDPRAVTMEAAVAAMNPPAAETGD